MDPVAILEKHVGYHETGDNCNLFSHYDGRPCEAWCFDTVDACYGMSGHPLPPMQPGCDHGAASVWYGYTWASHHGLVVPSWDAQRNDAVCFGWEGRGINGNPNEMHVALVISSGPKGSTLRYIGGNQSDQVSVETIPVGDARIMGVIQLHKFLGSHSPQHTPAPKPTGNHHPKHPPNNDAHLALPTWDPHWPDYMLKTPTMRGEAVRLWQERMRHRGWDRVPAHTPFSRGMAGEDFKADGVFGDRTAAVCWAFQHDQRITVDGKLGPQTWLFASREDNLNRDQGTS